MRLFKYVSLNAAESIIRNNSIGFTSPSDFNDPFDVPASPPVPAKQNELGIFSGVRGQIKSMIWDKNYGALSLTRSATNPLMWAHYAENHTGAVLEIDADIAEFNCQDSNFVPAFVGSVVYSRIPILGHYKQTFNEVITLGKTHRFVADHFEKTQRLFLTKPLDWAYEEEVRVVKCLEGKQVGSFSNQSGQFTGLKIGEEDARKTIFCFLMPMGSIKSLTFGARVQEERKNEFRHLCHSDIELKHANLVQDTFGIEIS